MSHASDEPACAVRGLLLPGGRVRLVTRNLALDIDGQTSFAREAAAPSALDHLLVALAGDLLAGFRREAERAGVIVEEAELDVSARLENALVAIGVHGESGTPAVQAFRGTLYVRADATEARLAELWTSTLARAPVYATLARAASIDLRLQPVS